MTAAVTPAPFQFGFNLQDGQALDNALAYPLVSTQDAITATASGTQATSVILSATINRIGTVVTAADGVRLPVSKAGASITLINDGANAMQVFGHLTATINDVASATGISQAPLSCVTYFCPVVGKWYTDGTGAGNYTGNFDGIVGATTPAAGTFTALVATTVNGNTITTGTGVLTIAAAKTLTASNTLTLAGTDSTTMTFPSTSATVAGIASTQTLTNKTITDFIDTGSVVCTTISATSGSTGTTLTNIPGFSVAVNVGTYWFRMYVTGTSTTNCGVKLAIANSGTTTSAAYTGTQHNGTTNNAESTTTTIGNAVGAATTVFTNAYVEGVIIVSGAGNLTGQFAQNASHADTTTINANGYMTVRRIS